MRLLTLTQPWATLVAIGAKAIETRSWSTSYRGPIAIHAGAGLGPVGGPIGLWRQCARQPFFRALEPHFRVTHLNMGADLGLTDCIDVAEMPRGEILAVVELVDCVSTEALAYTREIGRFTLEGNPRIWEMTPQEIAFGDYSLGRWGWLLADVRRLTEPLPYRGALGLRDLPADVAAEVERRAVSSAPPAR